MASNERLDLLLDQWEELREAGQEPTISELCRDSPDLEAELRKQIEALKAFDRMSPDRLSATRTFPSIEDRTPPPAPAGYSILRELGRGGMGVVYEAIQLSLNRHVALKMIRGGAYAGTSERERFRHEAEAVARLQHPNIVQIHEVGESAGLPYFALEYISGGTLSNRLRERPLPPTEAAALCRILAGAIHAAHQAGIVHRDLKPGNVLLLPDGTPKITDFGLAKSLEGKPGDTKSGQVLGTPSYMSPEQARGDRSVGPAADVYALGAVLYEMLTGRPPFLADNTIATLDLVLRAEPVPPSRFNRSVPRDLETICLKCLQKEPLRRYVSAQEFADDLGRFLAGVPVRARPVGSFTHALRWCRRNPGVTAAAVTVVFVLAVATAVSASAAIKERRAAELAKRRTADAEANYQRAKRAVDDLFVAVSEGRLRNIPGAQPIRKDLLRLALTYYQEFLAERSEDATNREAIAGTYTKVAMIVGEVETAEAAVHWHEKAVASWRELVLESTDRVDYGRELAGALDRYGLHLTRMNRLEDARRVQEEAVARLDALLVADPENAKNAAYQSRALTNLANTQGQLGLNVDAVRTSRRGIIADEAMARRRPNDLILRKNLVSKYINLGLDLSDLGRVDESIAALTTACTVAEKLSADWKALPANSLLVDAISDPRAGLASAELNLGLVLSTDEQQLREARHRLLASAAKSRELAKENPTVRLHGQVTLAAETNAVIAGLFDNVPAVELAAEAERACATGQKLASDDPSNPIYRVRHGLAHATHSTVLARLGKTREAEEAWTNALVAIGPEPDKNAVIRQVRGNAWALRALALLHNKDVRGASVAAQTMLNLNPDYALTLVAAAKIWSQCARLAPQTDKAGYEGQAIASLKSAIAKGYKKKDTLRTNPAFEGLRGKAEFLEMLNGKPEAK